MSYYSVKEQIKIIEFYYSTEFYNFSKNKFLVAE